MKNIYLSLALLFAIILSSCADSIWNGNIQDFTEEGVSTITLSSYDEDYIPSDSISSIEVSLINPSNLEGTYIIEEVGTSYLDNDDYSFDSSDALSDKKLYLTLNPDSEAEREEITLSLDITATSTGRVFDTVYLTIPCDTAPNDVFDLMAGATTTDAVSEVAFTLPSESTDDDLEYIEITYNINGTTDTTTVTLDIDEETYKSSQLEDDLDITPTESDYLRYYSPPEAESAEQYDYSVVLIDKAGQRSEAVPGSNGTEYFTITYESNGGSWINDPGNDYVTESVTLPLEDDISHSDGYFLDGWYDGTDTYKAGETVEITTNTTFTAQWDDDVSYTLTYYSDSASYEKNYTGTGVTLASATDLSFSESGYTFAGWSTEEVSSVGAEATVRYYEAEAGDSNFTITNMDSDLSLYAVWIPDSATPIRTNEELQSVSTETWDGDYYLCCDLDLSSDYTHTPIGDSENMFDQTFYGWGHTLSGLDMTADEDSYGFFGTVSGTVDGLTIEGADLDAGEYIYTSILTGNLTGSIENCTVKGTDETTPSTMATYGYTAGIAGYASYAEISNCTVSYLTLTDTSPYGKMGGIAGVAYSCTLTNNSVYNLEIDGGTGNYTGGQIGYADDCTITVNDSETEKNVVNDFTLTDGGNGCGGLIGYATTVLVDNCSLSEINLTTEGTWTGGVVGYFEIDSDSSMIDSILTTDGTFSDCDIATVNLTTSSYHTGGFVGYAACTNNSSSNNSFLNCSVTLDNESSLSGGDDYTGGFGGYITDANMSNCIVNLSDSTITGSNGTGGFTGGFRVYDDSNSAIEQCVIFGEGTVTIDSEKQGVGGFIGILEGENGTSHQLTLSECYSNSSIEFDGSYSGNATDGYTYTSYIGGLIGAAYDDTSDALTIVMNDCYYRGSFTHNNHAGEDYTASAYSYYTKPHGLLGNVDEYSQDITVEVDSCYTEASYTYYIDDTGTTSDVGLIYDSIESYSSRTITYNLADSYYQLDSGSVDSWGTSATTNEMTGTSSVMSSWDSATWGFDSTSGTNDGYPYLTNLEETY
ncbi:MAG: InlB B-repeat-containing protein [Spirochaetales bacterium]|nr:InlB B-repeat-containing protein [Spirochaetales bacterium]